MLPNFLICGTQRGGTTALFYYLKQHPDIYMPAIKEVNFFDIHYDKGIDWYKSFFTCWSGEKAVGEASPNYMWHFEVPPRIKKLLPNAKLIFCLRNPIERAYSNYHFNKLRLNSANISSFSKVIRSEDGYHRYIEKGFYYKHLSRFLEFFAKEQLHIIITEGFRKEPLAVLRRCFEFLEVDPEFVPQKLGEAINPTLVPRNVFARRLLGVFSQCWRPLRKRLASLAPGVVDTVTIVIRQPVRNLLLQAQKPPPMRPEDREYLWQIYREDIKKLEELLNRDLSLWR